MRDIYAYTTSEKLRRLLPGWLTEAFVATQRKELYTLDRLEIIRSEWRTTHGHIVEDRAGNVRSDDCPLMRVVETAFGPRHIPQLKTPELCEIAKDKKTAGFLAAVDEAIAKLTPTAQKLLAEKGVGLKLGRTMKDIDPDYAHSIDYDTGDRLADLNGLYDVRGNFIALAQGYQDKKFQKFTLAECRETLLETYAIALSDWIFDFDLKKEARPEPHQLDFFRARREDAIAIEENEKFLLLHCLLPEEGGEGWNEEQVCRDLFVRFFGEMCMEEKGQAHKFFPRTAEIAAQVFASMERLVIQDPDFEHIHHSQPTLPGAQVR